MAKNLPRPKRRLFVEGNNDLHVVAHVMLALKPELGPLLNAHVDIEASGNDYEALEDFKLALSNPGALTSLGVVLDADETPGSSAAQRWARIHAVLRAEGIDAPGDLPTGGWVALVTKELRVGAWIMPNNVDAGGLEAFLSPFVPQDDSAWGYAEVVVETAKMAHEAPFKDHHALKARLHTWLAWREEPGLPYGRAVLVSDLSPHADPNAAAFARWFEALFLAPLSAPLSPPAV